MSQSTGHSVARSQSAAGVARPNRARSKSPRRSLSPPNDRDWRYAGANRRRNDSTHQSNKTVLSTFLIGPWTSIYERALNPHGTLVAETRTFFNRVPLISLLYCNLLFSLPSSGPLWFYFTHLPLPRPFKPDTSTLSIRCICKSSALYPGDFILI